MLVGVFAVLHFSCVQSLVWFMSWTSGKAVLPALSLYHSLLLSVSVLTCSVSLPRSLSRSLFQAVCVCARMFVFLSLSPSFFLSFSLSFSTSPSLSPSLPLSRSHLQLRGLFEQQVAAETWRVHGRIIAAHMNGDTYVYFWSIFACFDCGAQKPENRLTANAPNLLCTSMSPVARESPISTGLLVNTLTGE